MLFQINRALKFAIGRYKIVGPDTDGYAEATRGQEDAAEAGDLLSKLDRLTDGTELDAETEEKIGVLKAQLAGLSLSQDKPRSLVRGLSESDRKENTNDELVSVAVEITIYLAEHIKQGTTNRDELAELIFHQYSEVDELQTAREVVDQLYDYAAVLAEEDQE